MAVGDAPMNSPESVRAERRAKFLSALPTGMSTDEMVLAWRDHLAFMADVYSKDLDLDEERKVIEELVAAGLPAPSTKKGKTNKKRKSKVASRAGKSKTKANRQRGLGKEALSKMTMKRARVSGRCTKCDKVYFKGDEIAGSKGEWFHVKHLTSGDRRKLDGRRSVYVKVIPGGAMESSRRKH